MKIDVLKCSTMSRERIYESENLNSQTGAIFAKRVTSTYEWTMYFEREIINILPLR